MIDPEDLAGPPSGGGEKGWASGVVVASIVGEYGLFCVCTSHAKVPNITLRGIQAPPGLLRAVQGVDAVLVGRILVFIGLFAHFHWFWCNHRWLSRYYEIGKVVALVGIISTTAALVYHAF